MKPYYEERGVTIYHGDCREVLSGLSVAVDVVVTDPPFGQTSLRWDVPVTDWLRRVPMSACGSAWIFGTLRSFLASDFSGWRLAQDIVWEKHNGSNFHADRFRRVHEQAAQLYRGPWEAVYKSPVFTMDATARSVRRKGRPPHTGHIEAGSYRSDDGGPRLMRSVIRMKSCHGYAEHETQKPIGILEPLIQYSCRPRGTVCDPFSGSGSTGVAAKGLGLQAILIEIREDQCEIAAKRLQQGALPLEVA